MEHKYQEYRCQHCRKLLFKGWLEVSVIEIKCKYCKRVITFTGAVEERVEDREVQFLSV